MHAGIRIILDGVFNHTGLISFAFADLKGKGRNPPTRGGTMSIVTRLVPPGSRIRLLGFGASRSSWTGYPAVREYLFDVTRHWLAAGSTDGGSMCRTRSRTKFWIEWRRL